jgi:SAM-dependent methyltransferase
MNEFIQAFAKSIDDGDFIQLVLSSPIKTVEPTVSKTSVRGVELKSGYVLQFTRHDGAQEFHDNLAPKSAVDRVMTLFGQHFRHAHLFTASADVTAKQKASGKLKMASFPPTKEVKVETHNRQKQYLIPEGVPCAFLEAIGVMNAEGRVYAPKFDKFRQVNRFLEFVHDVYATLPKDGVLRIIDFGCGKSYLTFAIHHLLVGIHQREVDMLGIDLKQSVIEDCQAIAKRLKCEGLKFRAADITEVDPGGAVDLVVSLHACDTATDVALARAVTWQAKAILSAPCCHHEFASKMNHDMLPSLHGHGILHERFAELTTDAYRSQMLDACGYRSQVIEFVDLEHTARNLLIRAVRTRGSKPSQALRAEADKMVSELGVSEPTLARLIDRSP